MIKKKGLIFLIAILLFGIIFVNNVKADFLDSFYYSSCTDTDGGSNYAVAGRVTKTNEWFDFAGGFEWVDIFDDSCIDKNNLKEYYCDNLGEDYLSTDHNCGQGFECMDGACVALNCPEDLGDCNSGTTCDPKTCGGKTYYCRAPYGWVESLDCNNQNYCATGTCTETGKTLPTVNVCTASGWKEPQQGQTCDTTTGNLISCPEDLGSCTETTTCDARECDGKDYYCRYPFGWVEFGGLDKYCDESSEWCTTAKCGGITSYCLADGSWDECNSPSFCQDGLCKSSTTVTCSVSGSEPHYVDGNPVRNVGDPANIQVDVSKGIANKEYTLISSYLLNGNFESDPKFESKITTDSSGSFSKLNQEIIPSTYVTGLYNAKLKIGQTPSGFLITTSCGRFYVCGQGEKWDSSSGKCISTTATPTCGNENQNCCSSRAEPGLLTCSQGLTCVNQKCVAGAACDTNNFPTRPCNFNNGCYQECGSKKYLCVDVQRTGFKWTEWLSLFKSYSSTECSTNACTQYNFPSSCKGVSNLGFPSEYSQNSFTGFCNPNDKNIFYFNSMASFSNICGNVPPPGACSPACSGSTPYCNSANKCVECIPAGDPVIGGGGNYVGGTQAMGCGQQSQCSTINPDLVGTCTSTCSNNYKCQSCSLTGNVCKVADGKKARCEYACNGRYIAGYCCGANDIYDLRQHKCVANGEGVTTGSSATTGGSSESTGGSSGDNDPIGHLSQGAIINIQSDLVEGTYAANVRLSVSGYYDDKVTAIVGGRVNTNGWCPRLASSTTPFSVYPSGQPLCTTNDPGFGIIFTSTNLNNFRNPLTFTLSSPDGTLRQSFTVTFNIPSNMAGAVVKDVTGLAISNECKLFVPEITRGNCETNPLGVDKEDCNNLIAGLSYYVGNCNTKLS